MRENVSTAESNQLEHAASSYLRSARHQPVQWHPWGEAAFARAQARLYEQVHAIKFGDLTKVQAARSQVKGFKPYRIPRLWGVWFEE